MHVAEDPDELALLRDASGALAGGAAALGVVPRRRRGSAGGVPGVAGRLQRAGAAAAGPHGPRRRRRSPPGARGRGHRVLCPRSNLHIGGELPDLPALLAAIGVRLAIGTDSLASTPDLSPWAEIATLARALPRSSARALAARRHPRRRRRAAARGWARWPGKRPGLIEVAHDGRRAATRPMANRSVPLTAHPTRIRWRARRMSRPHAPAALPAARATRGHLRADGEVQPHHLRAALRAGRGRAGGARHRPAAGRLGRSSSPWPARGPPRWASTASSTGAIDAQNPRTAGREIPRGAVSLRAAWTLTAGQQPRCSWPPPRSSGRCAWRSRRSRCASVRLLAHQALHVALSPDPGPGDRVGPGGRLDRGARRLRPAPGAC